MKDNIFVIFKVGWVQLYIGGDWTLDLVTGLQLYISVQVSQLETMLRVLTVELEVDTNTVTNVLITCH